ncbi:probable WRKY transcription factor 2 isoform X1, partial [Tanacetum coccineum]
AQPSPTTRKFPFAPNTNAKSSMMFPGLCDRNKDKVYEDLNNTSSFAFKLVLEYASVSNQAKNLVIKDVDRDDIKFITKTLNCLPTANMSITNILEENVVQPLLVSTSATTLATKCVRMIFED